MIVKEIRAKSILSKSKVYDYVVNPYVGCQHACTYCYARFMKRVTGHREPWGDFVDVKINAADLLRVEIGKKKRGKVWVSGVCDPYQPLEKKYRLTRQCLEILARADWPVVIDRMNYHYADAVYRKYGLEDQLTDEFFERTRRKLLSIGTDSC